MASLVKYGKYGSMNTIDTSTMVSYVIKFVSDSYRLQEDTTCEGEMISSGELFVKAQYCICMQENTNWYWEYKNQQQVIISPTQTVVNPCLYVVAVKDVYDIPKKYIRQKTRKTGL